MIIVASLVLAALVCASGVSLRWPACPVAVVTAVLSAVWLSVNNGVLEGPTLLTLSENHGVTVADFFSVAGAGLAGVAVLRWRNRVVGRRDGGDRSAAGSDGAGVDGKAVGTLVAVVVIVLFGVVVNVAYQWP